jgi:hypothetical protein
LRLTWMFSRCSPSISWEYLTCRQRESGREAGPGGAVAGAQFRMRRWLQHAPRIAATLH